MPSYGNNRRDHHLIKNSSNFSASSSSAASASSSAETLSISPTYSMPAATRDASAATVAAVRARRPPAKLAKTFSCTSAVSSSKSYPPPVRNHLAVQEHALMNQTFTFGSRLGAPPPSRQQPRRGRSSSIDSDFGDYTIHGAITGLFPRNITSGIKSSLASHISRKSYSQQQQQQQQQQQHQRCLAQNLTLWAKCAKLPSLEGCSPDRKCCQKQFASTRTQYELAKYKDTLKNK